MVDRLNARIQTIPNMEGLAEKAASEPMTQEEQDGLATLAALSGVPAINRDVRAFIQNLNNRIFSASVQRAVQ